MITDQVRPWSQGKKLQLEHLRLIDEAIAKDDEISNADLRKMLQEETGVVVSISTIERAKHHLG